MQMLISEQERVRVGQEQNHVEQKGGHFCNLGSQDCGGRNPSQNLAVGSSQANSEIPAREFQRGGRGRKCAGPFVETCLLIPSNWLYS